MCDSYKRSKELMQATESIWMNEKVTIRSADDLMRKVALIPAVLEISFNAGPSHFFFSRYPPDFLLAVSAN